MKTTHDLLVDIDKVKPDPNQPRKFFDEEKLQELSQSMKSKGLENPVVVDDDFMIVTGERRYRAAKLAGWKQLPVRIKPPIDARDRLERQMVENIHTGGMTEWETIEAVDALCGMIMKQPMPNGLQETIRSKEGYENRNVPYPRWVIVTCAKQLGKAPSWVYEKLGYLGEDISVQEYLQRPDAKSSYIREINRHAPEEHKTAMKQMVIKDKFRDRDTINEIIRKVKQQPDKAPALFAESYTEPNMPRNMAKVEQIAPEKEEAPYQAAKDGCDAVISLLKTIETIPSVINHSRITINLINKKDFLQKDVEELLHLDAVEFEPAALKLQKTLMNLQQSLDSLHQQNEAVEAEVIN